MSPIASGSDNTFTVPASSPYCLPDYLWEGINSCSICIVIGLWSGNPLCVKHSQKRKLESRWDVLQIIVQCWCFECWMEFILWSHSLISMASFHPFCFIFCQQTKSLRSWFSPLRWLKVLAIFQLALCSLQQCIIHYHQLGFRKAMVPVRESIHRDA